MWFREALGKEGVGRILAGEIAHVGGHKVSSTEPNCSNRTPIRSS